MREKQNAAVKKFDQIVVMESSSSSSGEECTCDSDVKAGVGVATPSAPKGGRTNILTPSVLASLDRSKISDRRAVQIIAPIILATGQSIEEYTLNRLSIRRYRQLNQAKQAAELKAEFNPQKPMLLHWDGRSHQR